MKRILLLGCGYWGKFWYKTILNSKYELAAVVDPNPSISIDDVPLFDKLEDVHVPFSHVIIATPVQNHLQEFTLLLSSIKPKNILVEKPCGLNLEEASLMQDSYPGFIFLHDPIYNYIKNNIDELGDILSFNSVRASMGPRIRTDVSIVEDYLIHDLYIFSDLFGFERSYVNSCIKKHHFSHPIQTSEIDIHFTKGNNEKIPIEAKMFSSWWWPKKDRQIVIVGTKGSYIWKDDELHIKREYYKQISGIDDLGNVGYKLVQDSTETRLRDFSSKSNLELELDSFISGKKPFSDNLITDLWKFMESIIK